MKKWIFVLIATLTLSTAPSWAAAANSSSLAESTGTLAKTTLGAAHDTAITTYLYAKLASRPDLSNSNLDISTNQGKVTLNGIVNNEQQAKEVRLLVEKTAGVKAVDASKMIVSLQDNSLVIKTAAAQPTEPPIVSETFVRVPTLAEAETDSPPMSLEEALEPTAEPEPPLPQTMKLAAKPLSETAPKLLLAQAAKASHQHAHHKMHHPQQAQKHPKKSLIATAKKHRHYAAKQPHKHTVLAHLRYHLTKHKALHHSHRKALAKRIHKQLIVAKKKEAKSVGQMTNHFLKTAQATDKPIPEE